VPGVGELFWAIFVTGLLGIPLGLSVWALLDCARRPAWAWALAERRQVVWMAAILLGFLTVGCGLVISVWYLAKVRPQIAAIEDGRLPPFGP
jgi:hypothetical protein